MMRCRKQLAKMLGMDLNGFAHILKYLCVPLYYVKTRTIYSCIELVDHIFVGKF